MLKSKKYYYYLLAVLLNFVSVEFIRNSVQRISKDLFVESFTMFNEPSVVAITDCVINCLFLEKIVFRPTQVSLPKNIFNGIQILVCQQIADVNVI